ncbi:uncharacterized protein BT62DRAFT_990210 [Guyanagaster necrorhizus]|uniref:Uncharacterized protein n=1 Tax=Guyanagaster necrorhizus TaxID=856835 RepID=A0A9P7W5P2_9AGAR|nr:uncharacterized protein BT62DRAFT_990210 [Guyanagaster necrorhizus MCA 3950]KAG7451751.1 hypothetical protein BT62DRAFT_990210 [Guyanagaster necrorhizus MCA 3950]
MSSPPPPPPPPPPLTPALPEIVVEAGSPPHDGPNADVDGSPKSSSSALSSSDEGTLYDKHRHKLSKYHDHDFLRGLAECGSGSGSENGGSGRFKVVAGDEAASIVRSYAGSTVDVRAAQLPNLNPVVFAFSTYTAGGRKVVDYYKTWKGIPKAHRQKGQRKTDFLDSEFKRVVKNLDKEYKRLSTAGSPSASPQQLGINKPLPNSPPPLMRQSSSSISANVKQAPQSPTPTTAMKPLPKPPALKLVDEPPPSGGPLTARPNIPLVVSDSVVSLPFLGPINGLTVHDPLPLRLVNPDLKSPTDLSSSSRSDQAQHAGKHRRSKHRMASADSRHSKGSRTASDSGSSTHTSDEGQGYDSDSPEILIVVVDENNKDLPTWHGCAPINFFLKKLYILTEKLILCDSLETNTGSTPQQPARAPSVRRSPWDGPLANTNGEVRHYGVRPGRFEHSDDDEEEEEEEEEPPLVPLRYALSPQPPRTPPRAIPQTGYMYAPSTAYAASLYSSSPYAASTATLTFSPPPPPPPYPGSGPYLSPASSYQNLSSPSFSIIQSPDSFRSFGAAPWVSAEEFHRYSNAATTTFQ